MFVVELWSGNVTGDSIIDVPDLDSAVKLSKDCPGLANGTTVQVSEAMEM